VDRQFQILYEQIVKLNHSFGKNYLVDAPDLTNHSQGIYTVILPFSNFSEYAAKNDVLFNAASRQVAKEAKELKQMLAMMEDLKQRRFKGEVGFELMLQITKRANGKKEKIGSQIITGQNILTLISALDLYTEGLVINIQGTGRASGYVIGRRHMLNQLDGYLKEENIFSKRDGRMVYLYKICELLRAQFKDIDQNVRIYPKGDIQEEIIESIKSDLKTR